LECAILRLTINGWTSKASKLYVMSVWQVSVQVAHQP